MENQYNEVIYKRFYSKVSLPLIYGGDIHDICWTWNAGSDDKGYGEFKYNKQTIKAHRFAYLMHNNLEKSALDKLQVKHHCKNIKCVNPTHLYVVPKGKVRGFKKCKNGAPASISKLEKLQTILQDRSPHLISGVVMCILIAAIYYLS